ncbi:NAD(P)-dependent oxidoreductase [Frankia sp. AgKG'84/4]|uniref:NAD(P)-dependent oxidoreductase n=1 Tax=Frankia sp. AgKG'84/4 TaxID=573490 RepID=UPI00200CB13A|nr:NAD(P)H-binding protein [Frankia sp. AgKG'84/4]MCL9792866.1 NAD(P)H-binding protein [Frankia sp. AgKG'84/4]
MTAAQRTQHLRAALRPGTPARVAVLGAGGRAGRAVSAEFVARGHRVLGAVRDARRHRSLGDLGVEVAEADALVANDLVDVLRDADVIVVAVTPFSAPPATFDGFDEGFYERVITSVAGAARTSPVTRLITIGLSANLALTDGRRVMDDPDVFPPGLLPFARAHARERPSDSPGIYT